MLIAINYRLKGSFKYDITLEGEGVRKKCDNGGVRKSEKGGVILTTYKRVKVLHPWTP